MVLGMSEPRQQYYKQLEWSRQQNIAQKMMIHLQAAYCFLRSCWRAITRRGQEASWVSQYAGDTVVGKLGLDEEICVGRGVSSRQLPGNNSCTDILWILVSITSTRAFKIFNACKNVLQLVHPQRINGDPWSWHRRRPL